MSFLEQLKARKLLLKSSVTNITHADGSQERILLSKPGETQKMTTKTYGFIVDTKPDFVPACILEDFLYLGPQDAVMRENVDKYQLTDILSVGIETSASNIDDENDPIVQTHFVECLDLPETNLATTANRTSQIIKCVHDKKGRILVHCNAGVSRSSAVCIAYLMSDHKMNFETAFALVKSKRECIRPNDGFLKQLKQMDRNNS
ncbi:dual specificity protein phosphatase 19 [Sitodiplosis mosellana]|uniref:dual specificity protein phosphatase 19 n=1 Tax=Sitodiplosis mosellana TaxID=263140 RepID=UPI0024440C2A|nr:dual specificity protein phosphatase 19 [Sitodiplosis mosellana]